jgi:hypothetical protein
MEVIVPEEVRHYRPFDSKKDQTNLGMRRTTSSAAM